MSTIGFVGSKVKVVENLETEVSNPIVVDVNLINFYWRSADGRIQSKSDQ
jgi:hypothetical protein